MLINNGLARIMTIERRKFEYNRTLQEYDRESNTDQHKQ